MTVSATTLFSEEWLVTYWDEDINGADTHPSKLNISYKYDFQIKAYFISCNGNILSGTEPYYCSTLDALVRKARAQLRTYLRNSSSKAVLNHINLHKIQQPIAYCVGEEVS